MSILSILHYPDSRLHQISLPVEKIDEKIKRLAADMAETMYAAPGIGLAAPQVGQLIRMIVVDVSKDKSQLMVLINPEILNKEGEVEYEEGCLSVPGIYELLVNKRAEKIKLRALDLSGVLVEWEADGLLAVCLQHEIDHLDGKLFVDYLSELKRVRIRSKLKKQERRNL